MILFEHTAPAWLIGTAVAAVAVLSMWSAARFLPRKRIGAWMIALLHALLIALLAWCLFLPGIKTVLSHLLKPRFVIVMDTSDSMKLTPSPELPTRWTAAMAALDQPWAPAIAAGCDLDVYTFDADVSRTLPLAAVRDMEPSGAATHLRESLRSIVGRYAGIRVVGGLLLSDGIDTREAFDDWATEARPFPIYTVRLEPPAAWEEEPDVRIDTVNTPRRVTVGWKTELKAVVSGQGMGGRAVAVRLHRDDTLLEEAPVTVPVGGGAREAVFDLDHPEVGVFTYRVSTPALAGEKQTNDNQYAVSVQVVTSRNHLLYVEGPPRWESKYLTRALRANPEMSALIFLRGAGGRFMTFGERGTMTPDMHESQLAFFKIVVLGNLDTEEMGEERAKNLVKFVEAGGSLILLGGSKGWSARGFRETPLRVLLPAKSCNPEAVTGEFPVRVTDSGRGHPAFAGDAALWDNLPPVLSVFPDAVLSPGASALAVAETPGGLQPVIVAQRYGQGKVAAVLTDSLWKWQLTPDAGTRQPYQRFWNQIIAWMTPEEQELEQRPLELAADREQLFLGETIGLTARRGGAPDPSAPSFEVRCEIAGPDGRALPFTMEQQQLMTSAGESFPGHACSFTAEQPGLHTARALAEIGGKKVESDPVSFFVKPFTPESVPRPAAEAVLRAISESSAGAYFDTAEALNSALLALEIEGGEEQASEYRTLWQHGLVIAVLIALLTAGWSWRKWLNMP
jgi:hypothetical protein